MHNFTHFTRNNRLAIAGILLLIVGDLISKDVFYTRAWGSSLSFLEPVLNPGISFGLPVEMFFIILVSLVVLCVLLSFWYHKKISTRFVVFFLAGLVGNLLDRIFLGGVRDFLVFGKLFVFNFADVYLSIAVALLLLCEISSVSKMSRKIPGKKRD